MTLPVKTLRAWATPGVLRYVWRGLTVLSLALVGVGLVYSWNELPAGSLTVSLPFLALAVAIYAVTYVLHTVGWHFLATLAFGPLPLRDNAEAVAASNLVKYLPTIAWYIANRTSYYRERKVAPNLVIAASLGELAVMIGVATALLLADKLLPYSAGLALLALVGCGLILASVLRRNGVLYGWIHRRFALELRPRSEPTRALGWLRVIACYGATWPIGVLFLWAAVHVFVPLGVADLRPLFDVWLVAGLASYAVSLSLGSLGIAREITLTLLLAQHWALPVAIATAIVVKTVLTLGEILCSALILGWLYLAKRRAARE